MDSLRGQLLIAGPTLQDPNFARTVVLVGEHNDEGALGVVLNRPSDTTVGEAVPDLEDLTGDEDPVYVGGPVQPSAVLVLAEYLVPTEAPQLVTGDVGFLAIDDEDEDPAPHETALRRARVFAGYAGWGPGQLESELERDDWIIVESVSDDVFDEDATTLWSRVLDRQGGHLRLLARMPLDPSTN
ncbi:MAG: putative transcriptional regulator [Solirubrobacteraceae bacterium]|nr:putative transcriptional regulator [Solirubrobacteraceae bacterium]